MKMNKQELYNTVLRHQSWRSELQVGAKVDIECTFDESVSVWMLGTVSQEEENTISIEFPNSPVEYDTEDDRFSLKLSKAGSKTKKDSDWRDDLNGKLQKLFA